MMKNKSNNKKEETIKRRIQKEKEIILEQLKKTPIVQVVCEKTGIGRSTYYRWKKEDSKFESQADAAILEGSLLVNDMAESQLLGAIKDKNMTAIIFWLKHHHPAYETRIELRQATSRTKEKLTPRQEEIIRQALKITSAGKVLVSSRNEKRDEKTNK